MRSMRFPAAIFAVLLWSQGAAAQEGELDRAVAQLSSANPSEVRGGLEALGLLGDARAVEPIAARARAGLPVELLEIALETLAILGRPEAGPTLFRLAHHRRPEIRVGAVRAIAATQPPSADRALIEALADADPRVRGAAAQALGAIGARAGLEPLFRAMDREVPEAPMAIGLLAGPAEVERFLGYLGRVNMDTLAAALSEMLNRADLEEAARLSIVRRMSELGTPGARQFLESFVASTDAARGGRPRQAAVEAIARMGQ